MTFQCLLSSGGVYEENQVNCLCLAFMMNDDNMQMQSLRTQEDVRLNFGIVARYRDTIFIAHFRHTLYPFLTDFTITVLYENTAEYVKFPHHPITGPFTRHTGPVHTQIQ
jgi:hypothetical protein